MDTGTGRWGLAQGGNDWGVGVKLGKKQTYVKLKTNSGEMSRS